MIPPTFEHAAFTDPLQRLYLSATLGEAGELERSFGRTGIKRVPVPPAWDRTGSGRRFFVFPELAAGTAEDAAAADGNDGEDGVRESMGLVGELLDLASKRLVLTPNDESARRIADALDIPALERYTAKDADTGIQPFIDAPVGTLLAPNRYDGMDLAADACRMMLMAGLPTASHLQDRFLESKLRALGSAAGEDPHSCFAGRRALHPWTEGLGRGRRGGRRPAAVPVAGRDPPIAAHRAAG
jgi:hypothetical protein